jgi:hypothetical protein
MNWDDYSEEEDEKIIKVENSKPVPEKTQTSHYKQYVKSNDLKRTNSASTKCTTSSFGNKKYLYLIKLLRKEESIISIFRLSWARGHEDANRA